MADEPSITKAARDLLAVPPRHDRYVAAVEREVKLALEAVQKKLLAQAKELK